MSGYAYFVKPDFTKKVQERRIRDLDVICGQLAADVIRAGEWRDRAPDLHFGVACALVGEGFEILPEFKSRPLGDERDGKIDLVAQYEGGKVAIELDWHRPRKRSITKLRLFEGYRIVVLRGHGVITPPEGIDEVICARVGPSWA